MTTEPLLSFSSVTFAYQSDPILRDLSFTIDPGEIVGYLGINGAGKTTTFLLACGFVDPQSGTVTTAAVNPSKDRSWTRRVGVMMEGAGIYPRLTVRRNLSFFAELYGLKIDLDKHLEYHGLEAYADRPASHLSQGYRRRLGLARATLHSPSLLLLDEPADGLDPGATDHLHHLLRAFREDGGAVVITSHRLEEVERLCDRVLLLHEGSIELSGTVASLLENRGETSLRELVLELQSTEESS